VDDDEPPTQYILSDIQPSARSNVPVRPQTQPRQSIIDRQPTTGESSWQILAGRQIRPRQHTNYREDSLGFSDIEANSTNIPQSEISDSVISILNNRFQMTIITVYR
jgi:hypothetical protein